MKIFKVLLVGVVACMGFANLAHADHIWINEFHYDNPGGDVNEFVEIAFRSGSMTSIADYSLHLYNGSNGTIYDNFDLSTDAIEGLTLPIANDSRSVTFYRVDTPGLQNGGPDGLVLSLTSTGDQVGTFLSYEGTFTGSGGPADGVLSTDVGVSEPGAGNNSSLSLMGVGLAASDFTWGLTEVSTSDSGLSTANTGQVFANTAIPEPSSAALLGLGLLGLVGLRRRK